jgi:hypothetical protein
MQRIVGDTLVNLFWSVVSYLKRGEYNTDDNESTVDRFLKVNANSDGFTECYITRYRFWGVEWGFCYNGGYVAKKSNWLTWAAFRNDRFPMQLNYKSNDLQSLLNILMKK